MNLRVMGLKRRSIRPATRFPISMRSGPIRAQDAPARFDDRAVLGGDSLSAQRCGVAVTTMTTAARETSRPRWPSSAAGTSGLTAGPRLGKRLPAT
jgi:hypothetical protein